LTIKFLDYFPADSFKILQIKELIENFENQLLYGENDIFQDNY